MLPSIAGPLFCIVLFQVYGDEWTLSQLKPIMLVGVLCELPVCVLMAMLSDEYAHPESQLHSDEHADKLEEDEVETEQVVSCSWCGCTLTIEGATCSV